MSNEQITISVEERKVQGKAVKQLRRDGLIPAVIHNHGKDSKIVMAPYLDMIKIYNKAGKHHPVTVEYGKDRYLAIIKDVDFEPKKHLLRHVVFNAIKQNQTVRTEVAVHLSGEVPAEKAGLMVIRTLDVVEIEALPKNLVDELTVDAGKLIDIGDKICVSDILLPEGVAIITDLEHSVATVEETRAQISEESSEESDESDEQEGEDSENTDKKDLETE